MIDSEAPFLTVITINKDNFQGLQKTVSSVASQAYRSYTHIIVDGSSKDGSIEYIESLAEEGLVKHLKDNGDGIYQAMNLGVREAPSDYVMILNSGDTLYGPNALAHLALNILDYDVAYGLVAVKDSEGVMSLENSPEAVSFHEKYQHTLPSVASSLFLRSKLLEVGCFNTRYRICSDVELVYKIALSSGSFRYIPDPIVVFDLSGISSSQPLLVLKERLQILTEIKPEYLVSFILVFSSYCFRRLKRLSRRYFVNLSKKFCRAIGP